MYSDMSTRISACASAKRNLASARASSVLPTPVGPEKMNEPIGRLGSLSPARERRMARDTALMASSWPTTERVELVFHPQQPGGLRLLQPGDRDAGPAGDDEGDGLLVDHRAAGLPVALPLLLLEPDLVLEIALLVAERRGPLEVLVADGVFLLEVDLLQRAP